jgi:hypothetical protein
MEQEDQNLMAKAILSHPSKARPSCLTAANLSHLSTKDMLEKKHGSHKSRVATKAGLPSQCIGSKSY